MMRLKILTSAFFIALTLFLVFPKTAQASEGTAQLTPTIENGPTCFVASVFMEKSDYKLLVTCRNLVYPTQQNTSHYILWGIAKNSGKNLKFGTLGFGKAEFSTKTEFSQLFVTVENNSRVRQPSSFVVARGFIKPLSASSQSSKEEKETTPPENFGKILEQPTPVPTLAPSKSGLFSGIGKVGIFVAAGIFIFLILLAFLTRSRG